MEKESKSCFQLLFRGKYVSCYWFPGGYPPTPPAPHPPFVFGNPPGASWPSFHALTARRLRRSASAGDQQLRTTESYQGGKKRFAMVYSPKKPRCPLKNSDWKNTFLFEWSLFRGTVFRCFNVFINATSVCWWVLSFVAGKLANR